VCDGVEGPEDGAEPGPGGAGGGCDGLEVIEPTLRVGVDCCCDCGTIISEDLDLNQLLKFSIELTFNQIKVKSKKYLKLWFN